MYHGPSIIESVERRIWSAGRKWAGNLIPALFALPPLAVGVGLLLKGQTLEGPGLVWIAASPALGWIAVNFFGLFQNGAMRREMESRFKPLPPRRFFVGMARPRFGSALDAHEDLGFLCLHDGFLEFRGEAMQHRLSKAQIHAVRLRPNFHSLVLLGRWISIEASLGTRPVRLLVEPRERATMMGNFLLASRLCRYLKAWLAEGPSAPSTMAAGNKPGPSTRPKKERPA